MRTTTCGHQPPYLLTNLPRQGAALVLSRFLELQPASASTRASAWATAASDVAAQAWSKKGVIATAYPHKQAKFAWVPHRDEHGHPPTATAAAASSNSNQHATMTEAAAPAAPVHANMKQEMYPHRAVLSMAPRAVPSDNIAARDMNMVQKPTSVNPDIDHSGAAAETATRATAKAPEAAYTTAGVSSETNMPSGATTAASFPHDQGGTPHTSAGQAGAHEAVDMPQPSQDYENARSSSMHSRNASRVPVSAVRGEGEDGDMCGRGGASHLCVHV